MCRLESDLQESLFSLDSEEEEEEIDQPEKAPAYTENEGYVLPPEKGRRGIENDGAELTIVNTNTLSGNTGNNNTSKTVYKDAITVKSKTKAGRPVNYGEQEATIVNETMLPNAEEATVVSGEQTIFLPSGAPKKHGPHSRKAPVPVDNRPPRPQRKNRTDMYGEDESTIISYSNDQNGPYGVDEATIVSDFRGNGKKSQYGENEATIVAGYNPTKKAVYGENEATIIMDVNSGKNQRGYGANESTFIRDNETVAFKGKQGYGVNEATIVGDSINTSNGNIKYGENEATILMPGTDNQSKKRNQKG
jgi:hypothetical protein